MKKLILLAAILLLNSCLALTDPLFSTIPDANSDVTRFPQNKKGIVLLKLSSDYLTTTWCQSDLEKETENKKCLKINPTDYYQIIMIEPGMYEIEGFKTINRRYQAAKEKEITPEISNITGKRKSPPTLAFEVFAGKISYAGHIKFHHISAAGSQVKNENFEEIVALFANKNEKKLKQIFKGHHFEEKIIAQKIAQSPQILVLNLAKTKSDFGEEKKIEKQAAREKKKRDLKLLKEKAKNFKMLQQQLQPRKTRIYAN